MISVDEAKKLKVSELKAALTEAGLAVTGKKDELLTRLLDHIKSQSPIKAASPQSPIKKQPTPTITTGSPKPVTIGSHKPSSSAPVTASRSQPTITSPTTPSKHPITQLSQEERIKQRMERFGTSVPIPDAAKLNATAPTSPSKIAGIDPQVLARRQERFGVAVQVKSLSADDDKKLKRLNKFGANGSEENIVKKQKV